MTPRSPAARRVLAITAVAFGLVVVDAAPASAHAELLSTDPQAGGVYDDAPESVTLDYSEPVEATFGAVRVYDGRGRRLDTGQASHPGGDSSRVRVDLPGLDDGSYVVTWRVLSADSHPVQGAFAFQIGPEATTTDPAGLAQRLLASQGGSETVGVVYALARFTVFASLALLVGGVVFLALLWPRGRESRRAQRLVWGGWVGAIAGTVVGLAVEGPYAAGLPLGDALDPDLLRDVVGTRFGKVWLARLVILLVAVPLLRRLLPQRPVREYPLTPTWRAASLLVGGAVLFTPGVSGHAASGDLVPIAVVVDALHLAAISVWLGGLVVLVVAMLPVGDAAELRSVVPRYSQLAMGAVVTIVATGAFQSWRQVGSLGALRDTDFGHLLVFKLIVFAGLIVVAAFSREVVNRRFRAKTAARYEQLVAAAAPGGAGGTADDVGVRPPADDATEVRNLRRSVAIEVVVAAVILVVAALLVNTQPARSATSGPYSAVFKSDDLWVDVLVDPARAGINDVHVTALTNGGAPTQVLEMEVNLTLSDREIAPVDVPLRRLGPGHYVAEGFNIPIAGDWKLIANVLVDETRQIVVDGEVPIR